MIAVVHMRFTRIARDGWSHTI